MRKDFRIAGSGGQGVIMMSMILAEAYGLHEKLEIAQTQSYGPEARGGACRAEIVISDKEIDYVKVDKVNFFIAFNETGFQKYSADIKPETIIFVNSTMVGEKALEPYKNNVIHSIPATSIAEENFKLVMANIIMLGFMAAKLDNLSFESAEKALRSNLPPSQLEFNLKALRHGYDMGV